MSVRNHTNVLMAKCVCVCVCMCVVLKEGTQHTTHNTHRRHTNTMCNCDMQPLQVSSIDCANLDVLVLILF